jgi:hypothetical protein
MHKSKTLGSSRTRPFSARASKTAPIYSTPRNLSDYTPIEQFQKHFTILDLQVLKLRQLDPPEDFQRLFSDFADLKREFGVFHQTCLRLIRSQKLSPNHEIHPEVAVVIADFPGPSTAFFGVVHALNTQRFQIYFPLMCEYFATMEDTISVYGNICETAAQTRIIHKRLAPNVASHVAAVRKHLEYFFSDCTDGITDEMTGRFMELLKGLSRSFTLELHSTIRAQKVIPTGLNFQIDKFDRAFVSLTTLLSNIPTIDLTLAALLELGGSYCDLLEQVLVDLRLKPAEPITLQFGDSREEKPSSVAQSGIIVIDPIDQFLNDLCELFQCSTRSDSTAVLCNRILTSARKTINDLNEENHRLKTRLESAEFIKSEKALNLRFEENQRFQNDLTQSFAIQRTALLRGLIDQLGVLAPCEVLHPTDDYQTRVDVILSNVKFELDDLRKKVTKDEAILSESLSKVAEFANAQYSLEFDEGTDLTTAISLLQRQFAKSLKRMEKLLTEDDPSRSELVDFLTKILRGRIENSQDLTLSQLKMEFTNFVARLEQNAEDNQSEIFSLKAHTSEFQVEVINRLSEWKDRLKVLVDGVDRGTEPSYENLASQISGLLELAEKDKEKKTLFGRFLVSFLSQVMFALHLAVPKFNGMADEQLEDVMMTVLDAPQIRTGLGKFETGLDPPVEDSVLLSKSPEGSKSPPGD